MTRTSISIVTCIMLIIGASGAFCQELYLYEPRPVTPDVSKPSHQDGVLVRKIPVQKGDTLSGISRKFSGHATYYPQILLFNDIKDPDRITVGDTIKVPVTSREIQKDSPPQKAKKKQTAAVGTKQPVKSDKISAPAVRKQDAETPKKQKAKTAAAPPLPLKPTQPAPQPQLRQAESVTELSLSELKKLDGSKEKGREGEPRAKGGAAGSKTAVKQEKERKPLQAHLPSKRQRTITLTGVASVPTPDITSAATPQQRVTPPPPKPVADSGQQLYDKALKAYNQNNCSTALELFDRFTAGYPGSPLAADASLYRAECYLKLSSQ